MTLKEGMVQIAPALLTDDLGEAEAGLTAFATLSRLLHVDVLDDSLVPGWTLSPSDLPNTTEFTAVWHLMVREPERYLPACSARRSTAVFVHAELGATHLASAIAAIHAHQLPAGIVLNPETPVSLIAPFVSAVAWVQVMTVEPGRQGASFLAEPLRKLTELSGLNPSLKLAVDGGIDEHTIHSVIRHRPAMITVGHYLAPGPQLERHWRVLQRAVSS